MTAPIVYRDLDEAAQIAVAKARKQVVHPINLDAIRADDTARNNGRRRRARRAIARAVARGVLVAS